MTEPDCGHDRVRGMHWCPCHDVALVFDGDCWRCPADNAAIRYRGDRRPQPRSTVRTEVAGS